MSATVRSMSIRDLWRDEWAKLGAERGSGRTSKQMKAAPKKAVFIVPNRYAVDYARNLARDLGRADLEIVTLESLSRGGEYRFSGRRLPGLVVDHGCDCLISFEQWRALEHLWAMVR